MKKDLKSLSYFELKAIAQRENEKAGYSVLNTSGKKDELIERLEAYGISESESTQEREKTREKLTISVLPHPEFLSKERLTALKEKLQKTLSGKGEFYFLLDQNDGSYTVEFDGGARGKWSQTLLVDDKHILKIAHSYIQRVAIGKDGSKTVIR